MTTRIASGRLQHRPFATLLSPTAGDAALSAGTVRAEIRALVGRGALTRHDGEDLLARLGLRVLPYRSAVAVSVPVSVVITAPNDRYAVRAGAGQLVAVLGWLRAGYLSRPGAITAPSDQPAHRSLRALSCRRVEACPGYPVGGIYRVGASALLAVMVTADNADAAYATAKNQLTADVCALTGIRADPARMRPLASHRFTGLDQPAADPLAQQQAPTRPSRREGGDKK